MKPTNTQGQNPFSDILAKFHGGGTPQGASAGGSAGINAAQNPSNPTSGAGMPPGLAGGGSPPPGPSGAMGGFSGGAPMTQAAPDVTQRGQNPGTSKFLTQALNAMNQFLTEATDPDEITIGRGIITLMTKLIERDQQKQTSVMQQQTSLGLTSPSQSMNTPSPMGASNANPTSALTSTPGQ